MHQFLRRNNQVIRTCTPVSQMKAAEMEPVRLEFCRCVMTTYKNHIKNPIFLVNMDKQQFTLILRRYVHYMQKARKLYQ